jgi:hypothetical protein
MPVKMYRCCKLYRPLAVASTSVGTRLAYLSKWAQAAILIAASARARAVKACRRNNLRHAWCKYN